MANPFPQLICTVNTYDPAKIVGLNHPDGNLQNIIGQIKSEVVWLPNWPYPIKDGDTIVLYGEKAIQLHSIIDEFNASSLATITIVNYGAEI